MPEHDEWFDKLYREFFTRLFKQAYYILQNHSLAEDLVEETFLILLYKKDQLLNHPNIAGWLYKTLKNVISDELKSSKHNREIPLVHDHMDSNTYTLPLEMTLPKELTSMEKEILILLYEKQLSYEAIAAQLGISVLNCRTRAFRAKEHYKRLTDNKINL